MMLGAIFAAGWTVADVLDLTWEQIGLVGECVAIYRSESISMVATPLLGALGGVVGSSPKKKRRDSPSDPREKDAALLASIGSAGFPIR